jgi:hypothetical protein
MATDEERDLLASAILPAVGRDAAQLLPFEVTGFLAMAGHLYDRRLMVIGRAVNGWADGILPSALASPSAVESYANLVRASVIGHGGCPMRWVTDGWGNRQGQYNTRRSAFWRVIRGVVGGLGIADVEDRSWPSHLVWSNLYKVAPCKGGNPGGRLCAIQQTGCMDLFRLELRTYAPSRLLLLTGAGWAAPFLANYALQHIAGTRYVERIGSVQLDSERQLRCVVAAHPQGTSETDWIREVVDAYDR